MNRRDFIKASALASTLPAISLTCKYEDDEKGPEKKESNNQPWPYTVYCYERQQGEWIFSENIRGSFAYQREYIDAEEDAPYAGWMNDGKLHFMSFEEACDFVEMHVRAKDDINIADSIYDIYRGSDDGGSDIQVAHYWFNGDTGRQVTWKDNDFNTNYLKMECA
tara:strand:- start:18808 stop:19302 length:495 start_codon:yes stop_codon:yes gene_type:complete